MLYELIAIVRPGSLNEVREIARNAGTQVIRSGGVVRGYTNWGAFRLPKVTTKHQARYTDGHHFIMRFDSSGAVQSSIRRTLGLDPRMINFSVVKLGDKLEEIKDVNGQVPWNNVRSITDQIPSSKNATVQENQDTTATTEGETLTEEENPDISDADVSGAPAV
ncbi:37S ribosomal protein [Penicillium brevicompactum]|uniref:uncharacterized protein n=1 Tax=Penicillium brevicompactum TaxID=5074 RepID=UPI0025425114|nr:uncharacterized protein N7506_006052 [Penicillium brevicompactum]KAJ5332269.1 hypothetical protein N7506_006052 [Penicillium brevicompactum]